MDILKKNSKMKDLLFIVFLGLIFFSLALPFLKLPGLSEDEAINIIEANRIVNHLPPMRFTILLSNTEFPIMVTSWVGPIGWLVFVPSFYLFGTHIYVLRITRLFFGFFIIILLYFFTKEYFNRKVAKIAGFLMATLPYYVFMYRQGYLDDGLLPMFALLSLINFYQYKKEQRIKYFYLGVIFVGLGLLTKLNFLWYIIAIGICFFLFKIKIQIGIKNWIVASLLFSLLLSPYILFHVGPYVHISNYREEDTTLNILKNSIHYSVDGGINNFDIKNTFFLKLSHLYWIFNYHPLNERNLLKDLFCFILIIFLFIYFLMMFIFKKIRLEKKVIFLLVMSLLIFFLSFLTVTVFSSEHLMILFPFIFILFSKFLYDFFCKKKYKIFFYLIMGLILTLNLLIFFQTYIILNETGSTETQDFYAPSDTIYKVATFLIEKNITQISDITADIRYNIPFLSEGMVNVIDCHPETMSFETCLNINKTKFYIFSLKNSDPTYNKFTEMLYNRSIKSTVLKEFPQRDGIIEFLILKLNSD